MPFLTLEDPNAKVKGSRDPLGTQTIWAHFGRRVVSNLTTQSTSVRGFTTLLLARYFTEQLVQDGSLPREEALSAFLRMEQLGAYARHIGHGVDSDIRGIERVKRFVADGKGRVPIGAARGACILADQKVYGLWGLYSVSARTSGLIADGPVGLSVTARDFVEAEYGARLSGGRNELLALLRQDGSLRTKPSPSGFGALVEIMSETLTVGERAFYARHLRDGLEVKNEHRERQSELVRLLRSETNLKGRFGREEAVHLAQSAREVDDGLASALDQIAHLEALLAPAAALFDFVLTQGGQRPTEVAAKLTNRWGSGVPNLDPEALKDLLPKIKEVTEAETVKAAANCHEALRSGAYVDAVESVLQWNACVSGDRKSAPWVRIGDGGRLDVRYRGSEQLLPDGDSLQTLWRNSYFVDALKDVTLQLEPSA